MDKTAISQKKPNKRKSIFFQDLLLGAAAGTVSKTAVAPIQRIKLLFQTQIQNTKLTQRYLGLRDCYQRILKYEGVLALWRGNWVNVIRYLPTQALSFAFKNYFNSFFSFKANSKTKILLIKIFNGGLAGGCTAFLVHPLDFARTRIGVDLGKNLEDRQFKGLIDCIRKTYFKEGFNGLYRGVVIASISYFIYRGLHFGLYDTGKQLLFSDDTKPSIIQKFFLAQISVMLSELFAYPGDTIKRKLMMQSLQQQKAYNGVIDCYKKITSKYGYAILWRGAYTNVLRSVGTSLCLLLFDQFKRFAIKIVQ